MAYLWATMAFLQHNMQAIGFFGIGMCALGVCVLAVLGWRRADATANALRAKEKENDVLAAQVRELLRELLVSRAGPVVEDVGDQAQLVGKLLAWAETEHRHGRYGLRDGFVETAVHIACQQRLVTPEFIAQLPSGVIEPQVRAMVDALIDYGQPGQHILSRAVGRKSTSLIIH